MSDSTIDPALRPRQDRQTITPHGRRLERQIEGVVRRRLEAIEDHRGEVTEVFRPEWFEHSAPLVYVYQVMTRPDAIKGWVVHEKQDDRIFLSHGTHWWALYDARPTSPTFGVLNEFVVSEHSRCLLIIPAGVFHAVMNIGTEPAVFINMPTRPYDHACPDKYRLPMDGRTIPFEFSRKPGTQRVLE